MRPGLRVGKYVLGDRIAHGGMAEVWAARVEGPEGFVKPVALKFILETFSGDLDFERLFVNEARVAAQLQHANLVTIFDFDKVSAQPGEAGRYYIAMEKVDGCDLRRVLQATAEAGRAFPVALALHAAGEVLKGLRYVHDRVDLETGAPLGLVHRDVSPHNVLVGMGGEIKLSDFGIAKAMRQSLGTQNGTIRGKLSYASPEQLRAEQVDHRTDQFALGVTLWEMLAQRRLFDGVDEVEIIGKVLRCEIPPLPETATGTVHPAVEDVVRKMLAPARDARFPTTTAALSAVLALPGYTHDGSALSELMTALFGGPRVPGSSTVRLDVATPTPPPRPLSPHTPPSSPSYPSAGNTRTVTGSELREASRRPPGRRRASGYVSSAAFENGAFDESAARAARAGRRQPPARSTAPWLAAAFVLLGVGAAVFFLVPARSPREHTETPRRAAPREESRERETAAGSPLGPPRAAEPPILAPRPADEGERGDDPGERDTGAQGTTTRSSDGRPFRSSSTGRASKTPHGKPAATRPRPSSPSGAAISPVASAPPQPTTPTAAAGAAEAPPPSRPEDDSTDPGGADATPSGPNKAPIIRDHPAPDGDGRTRERPRRAPTDRHGTGSARSPMLD